MFSALTTGYIIGDLISSFYILWAAFGFTAIYVIATGRRSWLRTSGGRRGALLPAALSMISYVTAGIVINTLT